MNVLWGELSEEERLCYEERRRWGFKRRERKMAMLC